MRRIAPILKKNAKRLNRSPYAQKTDVMPCPVRHAQQEKTLRVEKAVINTAKQKRSLSSFLCVVFENGRQVKDEGLWVV